MYDAYVLLSVLLGAEIEACAERVMTPHLVCVLGLKRDMAVHCVLFPAELKPWVE